MSNQIKGLSADYIYHDDEVVLEMYEYFKVQKHLEEILNETLDYFVRLYATGETTMNNTYTNNYTYTTSNPSVCCKTQTGTEECVYPKCNDFNVTGTLENQFKNKDNCTHIEYYTDNPFIKIERDDDDSYLDVYLNVAGCEASQIKSEFHEGVLTVDAKPSYGLETSDTYSHEVNIGTDYEYTRTASLKNGILRVSFRLKPEHQPVKITIE